MSVKSIVSRRVREKRRPPSLGRNDECLDMFGCKGSIRQTRRLTIARSGAAAAAAKNSSSSSPNGKSPSRFFVNHTYHDHAHDQEEKAALGKAAEGKKKKDSHQHQHQHQHHHVRGTRGGVTTPFPEKLHEMLSKADDERFAHIVSWQPHGRSFAVHEPDLFVSEVMPRFFKQSKVTSFQRQLNLYGFARLTAGPDRRGYYHELFLRGRAHLCKHMIRTRVKGTVLKGLTSPSTEPKFYDMEPCLEDCSDGNHELATTRSSSGSQSNESLSHVSSVNSASCIQPSVISDETTSSSKRSPTMIVSRGSCTGKLAFEPLQEMFIHEISVPTSPQAVDTIELDVTAPHYGKYQGKRCLSPMAQYLQSGHDELANLLLSQSGDEMVFEGRHFHYLDTDFFFEENESSGVQQEQQKQQQSAPEIPQMDDWITSFVEWQGDDSF